MNYVVSDIYLLEIQKIYGVRYIYFDLEIRTLFSLDDPSSPELHREISILAKLPNKVFTGKGKINSAKKCTSR